MSIDFSIIQFFIIASVAVYFVFDYFDQKKIKDEREEFIKLKTSEFVQRATLAAVTVIALAYTLAPQMPAFVPIIVIVICSMYSEIVGKIYYRQKF